MKVTISESQFIRMVNNSKGWGLIGINEALTPIKIKNKSDELELKYLGTVDGEPVSGVEPKVIISHNSSDYDWLGRNNPKLFKLIKDYRDNKNSLMRVKGRRGKTIDDIKNDAKKYNDYTEFNRSHTSELARMVGPCYDGEGNKVDCYYRKGENWNKSPGVHNTLEFFNSITSGMTRTNYGPKMVYSYTFFDDENKVVGVYVGITNDEERRKGEHLTGESTFTNKEVKSAVGNFIKENPLFRVEYKSLTEYIPFVDAQVKEKEYVNNAKSNGYNILNIAKTGGGGSNFGFPDKYLIDKVNDWIKTTKEKGKEPLLNDFTNDYINIYNNIRGRIRKGNDKIYDETLGKLGLVKPKKSDDQIIKNAQEWIDMKKSKKEIPFLMSYKKDFINNYNTIIARRSDGNEKLYNDTLGKMVPAQQKKTEEELIELAMSCNSYTEFITKYDNFYRQAKRKGLRPQIKQMFKDGLNTPNQTTPSV